jgi:hypothetical protein
MNPKFLKLTNRLEEKFRALKSMRPLVAEKVPKDTPKGGVYLFSENGVPLYAGRTKRKIGTRIRGHFSTADDCPFAWRLAREKTGCPATYSSKGSRKDLLSKPSFRRAYEKAKQRIRKMKVQFVEEADPLRQALLEIYVAVAVGAKHNDFDTH